MAKNLLARIGESIKLPEGRGSSLFNEFEERRHTKKYGERIDDGLLPRDLEHYKKLVLGMANPYAEVNVSYTRSVDPFWSKASPRQSGEEAWKFADSKLEKLTNNRLIDEFIFEAEMREKDGLRHVHFFKHGSIGEEWAQYYKIHIHFSEQPTNSERLKTCINEEVSLLRSRVKNLFS